MNNESTTTTEPPPQNGQQNGPSLWGDIGLLKLTFSEYGHVSYQIKGNDAYNYMSANVLPLHTSLTPGGTKGLFSVSSHVACLIKR